MKDKLRRIVDAMRRYNSADMAMQAFGLSSDAEYDLLVVAPSYTPQRLGLDRGCAVTTLHEGAYIAGYLVEKDGLRIAWIKIGSSAGNLIDHLALCAGLRFRRMAFIGAVGALRADFRLGELCTPAWSLSGSMADAYLNDSIRDIRPFEKIFPDPAATDEAVSVARGLGIALRRASVFCTPSVALEYIHLDEIRAFGTDLIEMETASFLRMADLMEVPGVALLVVSDNSATGAALIGRTEAEQQQCEYGRDVALPRLLLALAAQPSA